MTAVVRDRFFVPMDGDKYTLSARATEGQLWDRLCPAYPDSWWDGSHTDDPDLFRKQQIESEIAGY